MRINELWQYSREHNDNSQNVAREEKKGLGKHSRYRGYVAHKTAASSTLGSHSDWDLILSRSSRQTQCCESNAHAGSCVCNLIIIKRTTCLSQSLSQIEAQFDTRTCENVRSTRKLLLGKVSRLLDKENSNKCGFTRNLIISRELDLISFPHWRKSTTYCPL